MILYSCKTTVTVVHEIILHFGSLHHCTGVGVKKGCKAVLVLTKVEGLDVITHADMKHTVLRMDALCTLVLIDVAKVIALHKSMMMVLCLIMGPLTQWSPLLV